MIKKLKRKFILLTAISLFALLLVIVSGINIINFSSATVKIMKNIYGTFTKTLYVGATTNYTQRNKGYGLCPTRFCNTKAKLAIKQNDK